MTASPIVHRQEQGASNGEIGRELSALKRMFNLALHGEKITRKPYIPTLAENNVRQGFFERPDFDRLLAKLPPWLQPAVAFSYQVGWRLRSEILSLRWDQIDLESKTVRLYQGTTKNKDGRVIYLPALLRDVLEQQWREHLDHYPECPWVFHNRGERIRYPYTAWRRACKDAGLVGKIPYDFRRTAVRNMVRVGIPERVAMQIAGHKTRSIFDRYPRYHIVSEGDLKEAAQKLDTAFVAQTTTLSTTYPSLPEGEPRLSH